MAAEMTSSIINNTATPYQLIGDLDIEEYTALKRNIARHGVLVPVELDENGSILDGHHRIRAWRELRDEGIHVPDYPRIVRVGMSEVEKRTHARALNILRRQLTRERRRELIAQQLLETPEVSDRQIAKSLGVSPTTVGTTRKSMEDQVSNLDTSIGADGKTYPRKSTAVFAKNGGEEQRAIAAIASTDTLPQKLLDVKRVERIAREQKSSLESDLTTVYEHNERVDIRRGNFVDTLYDVESESVSLILTDPPYSQDHLHLWEELSRFGAEKLKPGGLLVTYSGQFHLPDVMAGLGKHLNYAWMIAVIGRGAKTAVHARRINSNWKPVLVYCRPPYHQSAWIEDVIFGDGPEKDQHNWQQALQESVHLVEMFSEPGDIVVDPFIGSGTNAVACLRLDRHFIGCDIDPTAARKSVQRIQEETTG